MGRIGWRTIVAVVVVGVVDGVETCVALLSWPSSGEERTERKSLAKIEKNWNNRDSDENLDLNRVRSFSSRNLHFNGKESRDKKSNES